MTQPKRPASQIEGGFERKPRCPTTRRFMLIGGTSVRQAIIACRKGGRVSMPAVYGGFVDRFLLGALMEKGLTLRTGQTYV